jgi:signal peptidase
MNYTQVLSRVCEGGYFVFLLAISGLAILNLSARHEGVTPFKILSVVSGSMIPALPVGTAIVIQPFDHYYVDDVVTYKLNTSNITHRIVYAGAYFLTKGDANSEIDLQAVAQSQIVGKVIVAIPFVGYVQESTKTLWGLIGFVYIPSVLILITESRTVILEFSRLESRKKIRLPVGSTGAIILGILALSSVTYAFYIGRFSVTLGSVTSSFHSPSPSVQPSPSDTPLPSPTPTAQPTPTPTPSIIPTAAPSACPTSGAFNCGNASDSTNIVIVENSNTTTVNQQNNSSVSTSIIVNSNTGGNSPESNGSSSVQTGNSVLHIQTSTSVNQNRVTISPY